MGCASSQPKLPPGGNDDSFNKLGPGESSSGPLPVLNPAKKAMRDSVMDQIHSQTGSTAGIKTGERTTPTTSLQATPGVALEPAEQRTNGGSQDLDARPSGNERRSAGSASTTVRGSTRSSFAADSAALHAAARRESQAAETLGPMAGRNKATAERLAGMPEGHGLSGQYVPAALEKPFSMLVVVPPDTPLPTTMLQNLWQLNVSQTLAVVSALQTQGVLRVATLDDGSTWCLVSPTTLDHLQHKYVAQASAIHAALLDAYNLSDGSGASTDMSAVQVRDIPDDGYIVQNMAHHLLGCNRLGCLRGLLGEPAWLESKLHAYGTAAVVADFRRYLAEMPDDQGVRLLLQAFQLSLGCCAEHPGMHMLREQMLARLINAAMPPTGPGPAVRMPTGGSTLGGTRREDSAHTDRDASTCGAADTSLSRPASLERPPNTHTTAVTHSPIRDSARYSSAQGSLREWFEAQSTHANMDMLTAAGRVNVHLLPRSASLKQAGGLQRMILRGHAGPIQKVVISPNWQDVVTISQDGSAQVWDMNVGDCVMQLARQHPLSAVDVAPDGCLCVVASVDGAACVWDLATGNVKHVLKGHTNKINSVAIDKRGRRCVTASDDRSVRVWDITKGVCQVVLAGHGHAGQRKASKRSGTSSEFGLVFDVALSSDGSMAVTASEDFTARVWDLDEAKCEHVLQGHSGWVVAVRFIGDTTHVITASHDHTARIWDGIRGCCLHVLDGHTGRLNNVRCDVEGRIAVTCSDDGSARIWDIETGKCKSVLQRHDAWVADAAITRDAERCVTVGGDGLVCVWDCSGQLISALEGHSGAVTSVVLTGGGRFAVTAGEDATAIVWDLGVKGHSAHPQQHGHKSKVLSVMPLPGRERVVTSSEEGEVLLWDVPHCRTPRGFKGVLASAAYLSVSQDGKKILAGSANRQVCCWSAETGELLSSLPAQQGSRVKHMAFSESGRYVGMVLFDSQTAVWDVETGHLVSQLIGRGERSGQRNVHTGGVNGILLCGSEEEPHTAVTWSKDCTARVWDVPTKTVKCVCEGHTDGVRVAAVSADSGLLATGSYANTVRLHLIEDGSAVAVLDHAASATHIAFSPDSTLLAVALDNHTLVVWNLVSRSCLSPVVAHKNDITGLVFSPDSMLMATCSMDCSLRVWDAHTGRAVAFFVADSAFTSCCFSGGEEGGLADILVGVDAGGATHFLDLPAELQPTSGRIAL